MSVILKEGKNWTDEGVFEVAVRLKNDELFQGAAKRDGDDIEVRIPTGIPMTDSNVIITMGDNGEVIIGRLVNSQFVQS